MKLSIVMPVYNEEKTINKIVQRVEKVNLGNIKKELIIINDASGDNTLKLLKNISKRYKNVKIYSHEFNQGKGAAIITGLKYFTGDIVIIQDGDLEYNPEEFKKLIKPILERKTKVVYGSRMLGETKRFRILSHYVGNLGLSLITTLLYFRIITDMETCYKMMTKDVIKSLKLRAKRFDFEPEITAKIIKRGYKIIELPINYYGRSFKEGKKLSWRDGVKALYYLLKYRFMD